jgi:hypothetical protein
MKLGDRKILINYIKYLTGLNKSKKKIDFKDNKPMPTRR